MKNLVFFAVSLSVVFSVGCSDGSDLNNSNDPNNNSSLSGNNGSGKGKDPITNTNPNTNPDTEKPIEPTQDNSTNSGEQKDTNPENAALELIQQARALDPQDLKSIKAALKLAEQVKALQHADALTVSNELFQKAAKAAEDNADAQKEIVVQILGKIQERKEQSQNEEVIDFTPVLENAKNALSSALEFADAVESLKAREDVGVASTSATAAGIAAETAQTKFDEAKSLAQQIATSNIPKRGTRITGGASSEPKGDVDSDEDQETTTDTDEESDKDPEPIIVDDKDVKKPQEDSNKPLPLPVEPPEVVAFTLNDTGLGFMKTTKLDSNSIVIRLNNFISEFANFLSSWTINSSQKVFKDLVISNLTKESNRYLEEVKGSAFGTTFCSDNELKRLIQELNKEIVAKFNNKISSENKILYKQEVNKLLKKYGFTQMK